MDAVVGRLASMVLLRRYITKALHAVEKLIAAKLIQILFKRRASRTPVATPEHRNQDKKLTTQLHPRSNAPTL